MARSQSQIGLLCETLLTADSDELRALQAVNTNGMIEGNLAYVVDVAAIYRLAPASTLTPDDDKVLAAQGGGNWLIVDGGDDPVEVYTLDDLPAAVANVITLEASTLYRIHGHLVIPTGTRIVYQNGSGIEGVGGAHLSGDSGPPLIQGASNGLAFRINNIAVVNAGASPALVWQGNNDGDQLWMHDVSMTCSGGAPAVALIGGGSLDYVNVYDSRFIGTPHDLEISSEWGAVMLIGCRFLSSNNGVSIESAATEIDTMQINGCEFIVGTGDTGVNQQNNDSVTLGRLTGNLFFGTDAGDPPGDSSVSANLFADAKWQGRGNVNLTDF
jgi:hypothetical protein